MESKELNKKISQICDKDEYVISGGKCIPYIGWFWRDVDFDSTGCSIGDCGSFKGFMENNKWGYPEFWVEGEDWEKLKKLLEITVTNPSRESTKVVWDFIQALNKRRERMNTNGK